MAKKSKKLSPEVKELLMWYGENIEPRLRRYIAGCEARGVVLDFETHKNNWKHTLHPQERQKFEDVQEIFREWRREYEKREGEPWSW